MKKRCLISFFAFGLAVALSAAVHAATYRIVRLSQSPIIIGDVEMRVDSTFSDDKKIEWTDDRQVMQVVNTATGRHYTARRRVNPNAGRTRTIKDFIIRTSYGSTRDPGDDATLVLEPSPVGPEFPERRAALVIGNSNYGKLAQLRNAQGDAAAVADELSRLGFDVMQLYEADDRSMKNALRNFARQARGYDFVMFYFAGHGVQEDGNNYLLPVEARLEFKSELRDCLNADDVVHYLDAVPAMGRLIVLDACRNARKSWARDVDEGLARMEAGEGTVILFSTQSGKTALDGDGEHSPFATALLSNIVEPDVDFTHAINNVVRDTYFATQKLQYPLLVGALLNDFAFNSAKITASRTTDSDISKWIKKGNEALENENYAEALKWYRRAAEHGYVYAQYNLGLMYYSGQGMSCNYTEAVKWYRKAAEQGHVTAQFYLGLMYYYGQGVSCNYTEALKWYRKAAEQGHAIAQTNVGFMYYKGEGVDCDYAEALSWFHKAADQGRATAQYNLGLMYYHGQGVSCNYTEALKWFSNAAEQGDATAYAMLGWMYYAGKGTGRNYAEALSWFHKAAEQGHATAQYNLGAMYFEGKGTPKDLKEGKKWMELAAEQGEENAIKILREWFGDVE